MVLLKELRLGEKSHWMFRTLAKYLCTFCLLCFPANNFASSIDNPITPGVYLYKIPHTSVQIRVESSGVYRVSRSTGIASGIQPRVFISVGSQSYEIKVNQLSDDHSASRIFLEDKTRLLLLNPEEEYNRGISWIDFAGTPLILERAPLHDSVIKMSNLISVKNLNEIPFNEPTPDKSKLFQSKFLFTEKNGKFDLYVDKDSKTAYILFQNEKTAIMFSLHNISTSASGLDLGCLSVELANFGEIAFSMFFGKSGYLKLTENDYAISLKDKSDQLANLHLREFKMQKDVPIENIRHLLNPPTLSAFLSDHKSTISASFANASGKLKIALIQSENLSFAPEPFLIHNGEAIALPADAIVPLSGKPHLELRREDYSPIHLKSQIGIELHPIPTQSLKLADISFSGRRLDQKDFNGILKAEYPVLALFFACKKSSL
ncbi:MAG: hypothetical protein JWQ35_1299 [Bacteriovoracaceae bacterium]|nr:hypothetical protein [Bacteriovoracaceae bacterium]